MRPLYFLQRLGLGGLLAAFGAVTPAVATKVTLAQDADGRWQWLRDGTPYSVRGVGGYQHLEQAAAAGATTIRTWGAESLDDEVDGKNLLDRAHALGLTVLAGLWVQHAASGFDYDNAALVAKQREEFRAAVRKHRGHPALLAWGVGNEAELGADVSDGRLWRELEQLLRIVKAEDPAHPVLTVLAGGSIETISQLRQLCPSLDLIGLNVYGWAPVVNTLLNESGWDRPYLLTEFGPRGQWEVLHTPWNAPIEPNSVEKTLAYVASHRAAAADPRCVGTFCFTWGQKQEATATWFGMFLATGEKTPAVDAMAYEFTGKWPANRSPQIYGLKTALALDRVPPSADFTATVEVGDPENDALTYEWCVVAESTDRKTGGAAEAAPPVMAGCIMGPAGPRVTVRTPETPGAYRLFIYVRDGRGGGCTQNVPFFVQR